MRIGLPVDVQLLTMVCNVGNNMATFLASGLANGGQPGMSRSKYRGIRIEHIYHKEACSADTIHA